MAYIDYISYHDASDELKKLYDRYGGADKVPANIMRISGVSPPAMEGHAHLFRAVMTAKSSLSRTEREMIAVMVSGINSCHY